MQIHLENFDERIHPAWQSVAEEPLPLRSHNFDEKSGTLSVLDQRLLPHRTEFVPIECLQDGFDAIKQMKVRGAPLIATVGMLTLLVEQARQPPPANWSSEDFAQNLEQNCRHLLSARPTAINLANAFLELRQYVRQQLGQNSTTTLAEMRERVRHFVLDWQARERRENDLLLRNGVTAVLGAVRRPKGHKLVAMTICNTGQLATSSYGTALGVILLLHRLGHLELALVLETRPYNQGSRLTAYELQQGGVPFRLIPDSAAAAAMRHFGVDVVLAGADQVAANGDTANKIGTYTLAIAARHHAIPFFIVTPISSANGRLPDGSGILVEERPAEELTQWNGLPTCPPNCPVWNPAFDITPAPLVSGFLTERGNFAPEQLAAAIAADAGGQEKKEKAK